MLMFGPARQTAAPGYSLGGSVVVGRGFPGALVSLGPGTWARFGSLGFLVLTPPTWGWGGRVGRGGRRGRRVVRRGGAGAVQAVVMAGT